MNVTPDTPLTPSAPDAAAEDGDATPVKPVRRRRAAEATGELPVAPGESYGAEGVDSEVGQTTAGSGGPPANKPRRRRTAVVVADDSATAGLDSAQAEDGATTASTTTDSPSFASSDIVLSPASADRLAEPPAIDPPAEVEPEPAQRTDAGAAHPLAPNPTGDGAMGDAGAAGTDGDAESAPSLGVGGAGPLLAPDTGDDVARSRRRNRRDRIRNDRDVPVEGASAELHRSSAAAPVAEQDGRPAAAPSVSTQEVFAHVLSGHFDSAESAPSEPESAGGVNEAAALPKRVLEAEADAPKLHKVLAQSGIGSRRDMEALIEDGQVMVNGETAHVGQRVSFGDQVQVKGKPVRLRIVPPAPRIIAYHKPVGEIVTHDDPQNRPTVFRRLPRLQQGKWQSVGRLDINTEGLLLFTNSGELANQLMHPRFGVEREYAVRVMGICMPEHKARLLEGVEVDGQTASFRSIEDGGGDGANHWYRVVITEGRNREVRKLFDSVGLTVSRLIRIRYGTVVLPFGLKRGVWVDLEPGDVGAIRRLASHDGGSQQRNNDRGSDRGERPVRSHERGQGEGPGAPRGERPNDRKGGRPEERGPRQNNVNNNNNFSNNVPRSRPGGGQSPAPVAMSFEGGAPVDRDPDADIDFDPMSIPNPLEQTFDKRFVQNPRSPAGGRGFRNGGGGFGAGGSAPDPVNKQGQSGPKQPDPMQTSLGFIGADAYHRKTRSGGSGGGGGNSGGAGGQRGNNRGGSRGGGFGNSGGNEGGSGGGYNGPGGGRRGR